MQPRVIVSTDIGGGDKDDAQSFIHAVLYADKVDYRGFVATSSDEAGVDGVTPLNDIIDAYAIDVPNLRQAADYPDAEALRSLIHQGATDPTWPGELSAGAQHIITEAHAASPEDPLYLLAWGPIHDISRALYEDPTIAPNVRVISIAASVQDRNDPEAYEWLTEAVATDPAYNDLFWINSEEAFRGMYVDDRGTNNPNLNLDWVNENVAGHGALGELYYVDYTFDLFGLGAASGLKMGDTPSLLYLLDEVSNDDPTLESWGGSFQASGLGPNVYVDRTDGTLGRYEGAETVFQHRDEVWGDFADRLDIAKDGVPGGDGEEPPTDGETPGGEGEEPPTDGDAPGGEGEEPPTDGETPGGEGEEPPTDGETPGGDDPTSEGPAVPPWDPLEIFEDIGTSADDSYRGDSDSDSFFGAGGSDNILGRGADDVLGGGSGSDTVVGGAGDDVLVYTLHENEGSDDVYIGSRGIDTLQLQLTQAESENAAIAAEIAELESFIAANRDEDVNGGAQFQSDLFGLNVRSVEEVDVVILDGEPAGPSLPPPTAVDDNFDGVEDGEIIGNVLANDDAFADDPLMAAVETGPDHGTLDLAEDGSFTYTPDADFAGTDSFVYRVTEDGRSATATATLSVSDTPDAPVAVDDEATAQAGRATVIDVLANDSDADEDVLSIIGVTQGDLGAVDINSAGEVVYLASDDAVGDDSFTYTVTDGTTTQEATVSVQVTTADPLELTNLPDFDSTGTSGNDRLAGSDSVNSFDGLAGDDIVLGRGDDDVLAGGAGSDFVTGGADDDRLIYVIDDNIGASDQYQGSNGIDTLEIYVSEELSETIDLEAELAAFRAFAAENYDTDVNGGARFTFSAFDLTVQSTEEVALFYVDLG